MGRVLDMIRSCVASWQEEKNDLLRRLADMTTSIEALEAEKRAVDQAAAQHREVVARELQSHRDETAAAETRHQAELQKQLAEHISSLPQVQ